MKTGGIAMTQHIHEGTPQELAPYLAQRPQGRFRLIDLEEDAAPISTPDEAKPVIDAENAAAIALLQSWREQDATNDPEEIRQAEEELAEFKRNMNANRAATGERSVYP
jgi:hypothetical protein